MSEIKVSCKALHQTEEICRKYNNDPGELITILHETQNTLGYLPEPVQRVIARELATSRPLDRYEYISVLFLTYASSHNSFSARSCRCSTDIFFSPGVSGQLPHPLWKISL